ncbi:MAG TPA: inorganic phosphate transporter [Verrucomicrobiae bacterium]|nr:inorganic phosphate transporter [Verrucomicrobiae bacterium]
MESVVLFAALFLAFVNGANDNMKGVATLYGSGVLGYRGALALATGSTLAGSLASVFLASGLVSAFSAKGLVPQASLTPAFLAAAGLAAGATVLLATRFGFPVSTTHALLGGLAGAGFVAAGPALRLGALGAIFVLPLVASPLLAVVLASGTYVTGRAARRRFGVEASTCVCVGEEWVPVAAPAGAMARAAGGKLTVLVEASPEECRRRYVGSFAGVSAQSAVTAGHVTSAAVVGFARGLNDTPKILGLVVGASALSPGAGAVAVSAAIAVGGLVGARRVAETLARRLTPMNEGQGLAGNLSTSILVAGASGLGLPVSTTHVATGGIFGIGAASGELRWRTAGAVALAWVTTLPLAALLGAAAMAVLR